MEAFKAQDQKCIWTAICYRVAVIEHMYEEEEGAATKLLGLLKRMGVSDIVIGIRNWPDVPIAQHDIYRMILGRAKEILIDTFLKKTEEKPRATSRRVKIVEIESLPLETHVNNSFDSMYIKPQLSRIQLDFTKQKISEITTRIEENEIKALQEFINHTTIGKLLAVLLTLLQKQKPTLSMAKQFYMQGNVKILIEKTDPLSIPKLQIQRAKKMFSRISHLKSSHFEKISRCAGLIFQYIRYVLTLTTSNIPVLPQVQRSLLSSKGEYLKSKHVRYI